MTLTLLSLFTSPKLFDDCVSIKFTNNTTSVTLTVLSLFKSAQTVLSPFGIPQLSVQLELSPPQTPQSSFSKPLFGIPSQPKSDSL